LVLDNRNIKMEDVIEISRLTTLDEFVSKLPLRYKRLVKNFVFPIYNVSCKVGLCY